MVSKKHEQSNSNNLQFDFLFSELSPEIAAIFTNHQIEAIKKSIHSRQYYDHPIDLRISVLLPPISFYVMILVGEERRSKQRLQYTKSLYPFWTFPNICFLSIFSAVFIVSMFNILFAIKSLNPNSHYQNFPTSIPDVKDQEKCEKFQRKWKNEKCWDEEHSPYF